MKFILCLILVAGVSAGALRSAPATSFKALRAELKLGDLVGSGAPRGIGARGGKGAPGSPSRPTDHDKRPSYDFLNIATQKCKTPATMPCEVCQHWIKAAEGLNPRDQLPYSREPAGSAFARAVAELKGTTVNGYACGINKEWEVFAKIGMPLVKLALVKARGPLMSCLVDNKVSCGGSIPATCTAKDVARADKATCEAITGADVVTDAKCKAVAGDKCKYTAAVTKHKAICKVAGCCA
jgi:hypothetical protein